MRISSALRASLIALPALAGVAFGSAAYADSGGISFSVIKAGLVIGGSAGSDTLTFHGKRYAKSQQSKLDNNINGARFPAQQGKPPGSRSSEVLSAQFPSPRKTVCPL
jgi:hypothetical protein